jgi:hypothetical protein
MKSYRPSPISDLGGRDSGAPDPPPFRALMPNPQAPTLPIGFGAIGKLARNAPGRQGSAAGSVCGDSALDENRHLPICRLSRPDLAFFLMEKGSTMTTEAREPKVDTDFFSIDLRSISNNRGASREIGPPYVMAM